MRRETIVVMKEETSKHFNSHFSKIHDTSKCESKKKLMKENQTKSKTVDEVKHFVSKKA